MYSTVQYQIALDRKTIKQDELGVRNQLMQTVTDTEKAYYELIRQSRKQHASRRPMPRALGRGYGIRVIPPKKQAA